MNGLPPQNNAKILIIDDTPMNVDLLSALLSKEGYDIQAAGNGSLALDMVQQSPPDLILLDIMMPGLDGYQVCQALKANEQTREIPVIFISALDHVDDIVKAFEVGGVDYITKPFQRQEVRARVKSHLTLIQQRRQIEEQLQHEVQTYQALDKMKDQFIYSATHDLKNPLNIILGFTYLLENIDGATFEVEGKHYLAAIQRGVMKMQALIQDMLELAKLQANTKLSLSSISLNDLLAAAMRDFEMPAREKNITLTFQPCEEAVTLWVDQQRMARVIENLVSNAIKYTPEGGTVQVRAGLEDNTAIIQVTDTGLGIPEKDLPHLFEPFFRVQEESHQAVEGTGVGLTIVQTIVQQHGGHVSVESELGKGSTFRIALPL